VNITLHVEEQKRVSLHLFIWRQAIKKAEQLTEGQILKIKFHRTSLDIKESVNK